MSNSSINIQTTNFTGYNLGSGTTIYDSVNPFNQLNFKSLVGAGSISVISGGSEVTISASTASGEANAGTNVGTGAQVYKDKLGTNLRFKTLLGTGSVGISTVGDEIFISAGTEALGAGNITEIQYNNSTGNTLGANSGFTFVEATQSFTLGNRSASVEGKYSSTQGNSNKAIGNYSHAGGQSSTACGYASFSHGNTNSALGCHSAIIGGQNNNIAIGNTNATILGGNNIDLTGTTYIDTTGVGSLAIITSPANNVTSDEILVRNTSTGVIDYISKASMGATDIYVSGGTLDGSAILALARSEGQSDVNIDLSALSGGTGGTPAGSNSQIQFNDSGSFGADPQFTFSASTNSLTIGSRSGSTEGLNSFTQGCCNSATGQNSHAEGFCAVATGNFSHAEGYRPEAIGGNSHAEGSGTKSIGGNSHAEGLKTIACGVSSHAEGGNSHACGNYSHAGGCGSAATPVVASGVGSFNHSTTLIAGCGAFAGRSAILGGFNHNIEVGNTNAAIIGGSGINLTGSTYVDHTAVDNLVIWSTPTSGNSTQILARNTSTGIIEYTTVSGGGGISTANNGLNINSGTNVSLGGTLTGDTCINLGTFGLAIGVGSTATGQVAFSTNCSSAIGACSHAEGDNTQACGTRSHAEGYNSIACANAAHAEGFNTCAIGIATHTEGFATCAVGSTAHAQGQRTRACGENSHAGGFGSSDSVAVTALGCTSFNHSYNTGSQTAGHGALANRSAILGGRDHNIESGNVRAAIIGGNTIKLTGTSYIDTTAVGNLAIMNTPSAGGSNDLLTWETGSTGIGTVRKVTQASVSDARLKTIIQPIQNPLDGIIGLNGYEYEFNELMQPKSMVGEKRYGLIAQDVETKFPLVVKDNIHFDNMTYKSVEYRELVPVLVEAIKELTNRIKILENK